MSGKKYEKLVRDNIPDILQKKGVLFTQRLANQEEYKDELIKKLYEESFEFSEDGSIEELADVIEVVEALRMLPEYGKVDAIRQTKKAERGGFDKRIILKGEK